MTREQFKEFIKELRALAEKYNLDVGGGGQTSGNIVASFRPKNEATHDPSN